MNKLSILLQQLHIDTNQAFSQADITREVSIMIVVIPFISVHQN